MQCKDGGRSVRDPQGFEGPRGEALGLGLLDVETELTGDKTLSAAQGATAGDDARFKGYEMHLGLTFGPGCDRPMVVFDDGRRDGAISADGRVRGCYAHGLFSEPAQRSALLARLGGRGSGLSYEASVESALDAVAAHLARHIDLDRLLKLAA